MALFEKVDIKPPHRLDPITLEIVGGAVESVRQEMEIMIERTARSVVIREGRDYRAGVFDRLGRNVSSASGAAHVDPVLQTYQAHEIEEGDVFIWNDPYKSAGGLTHLPDFCLTQPVFWEGEIAAYVQAFGHMSDVGGLAPGSTTVSASDIHQEGIIIPPVKLVSRGNMNEPLYRTIINNGRYPDDLRGDLDAEIMACRVGARRIRELIGRYGFPAVDDCFEALLERCARILRDVVFPQIPDGSFPFEDFVEVGGISPREKRSFVRLKVTMIKKGDHVTFDFTGTGEQSLAAINMAGDDRFYIKYLVSIFRTLAPDTVFNAGAVRAISCILPKRSILSAEYPAACAGRAYTLFRVPEVCLGALNKALGRRAIGSSDTRSTFSIATTNADGERVICRDMLGGGGGGRPDVNGSDALNGNVAGRSVPTEFMEAFYPMVVERDGLAMDSGGPGHHRGGLGCERVVRFTTSGLLAVRDDRLRLQPWGVCGGRAGSGSRYVLTSAVSDTREITQKIDALPVNAGDRLAVRTCGGGGWGDPLDRPGSAVVEDVRLELVSRESAVKDYGVVIDSSGVLQKAATEELRAKRGTDAGKDVDRGSRFAARLADGELDLSILSGSDEVLAS